jgi:hypothetical protein
MQVCISFATRRTESHIDPRHRSGAAQARNVERLANSSWMLDPAYLENIARYVKGVGSEGKK